MYAVGGALPAIGALTLDPVVGGLIGIPVGGTLIPVGGALIPVGGTFIPVGGGLMPVGGCILFGCALVYDNGGALEYDDVGALAYEAGV